MNEDDPAVYLQQEPTAEERLLAVQAGRHDGDAVPFWMFAKLAVRAAASSLWIGKADVLVRKMRRHALAGLATLAANLAAIGGYALHHAGVSAAADERAIAQERANQDHRDAMEREIQELRLDVRELRAAMRKMVDAGGTDLSISSLWPDTKGPTSCCARY